MWQPIETAPKDGVLVLTYCNGQVISAYWSEDEGWTVEIYGIEDWNGWTPTHWTPLPSPPESGCRLDKPPVNPDTGKPYFHVPEVGYESGTWKTGKPTRFFMCPNCGHLLPQI